MTATRHWRHSLKARFVLSGLLLIVVLLPAIGFTVNKAFERQIALSIENQLNAYMYSILAVTEVDNGDVNMPPHLVENQFNVIGSGLYALVSNEQHKVVWSSGSFFGLKTPTLQQPPVGESQFYRIKIDKTKHVVFSFTVSFALNKQLIPITIHIIKDESDYQLQAREFNRTLWSWIGILMLVLVAIQAIWLAWTLKPLRQFSDEITLVEQGKLTELNQQYPNELSILAKQLNVLLHTEQQQRKRYRNALSDLAHSLKTPLAVIKSQPELNQDSHEQLDHINHIIGYQLKKAQSVAANAWHLGVNVDDTATKLVRTLSKIYHDSHKDIDYQLTQHNDQAAIFKGDSTDLSEMIGNLLDNACKAAKYQVLLTVETTIDSLHIIVEDDGPGLTEVQQTLIFERGARADTYQQGHGIGLAIVSDLVNSYQGKLNVGKSNYLGGAKFSLTFTL
ncbi:ATP-binding protein [Shewanella sp. HL-SH5]|uniref:ATP-binding protein n=1 Tax=Shewanella sp. HL-SH5 TaxID=3436241 RepID=UPI003EB927D3